MRVLVIEDEPGIADVVCQAVGEAGYNVDWAPDGATGLRLLLERTFDVAVIDLMLPKVGGLEVITEIRSRKLDTAVLVLTARSETSHTVSTLNAGADDYLVKPFNIDELVARVGAVSRRFQRPIHQFGDITIDFRRRQVHRHGRQIYLSPTEFTILELLVSRQGTSVRKREILSYVWPNDRYRLPNTVEVYINFLRTKLETGGGSRLIHTDRGMGYRFEPGLS